MLDDWYAGRCHGFSLSLPPEEDEDVIAPFLHRARTIATAQSG